MSLKKALLHIYGVMSIYSIVNVCTYLLLMYWTNFCQPTVRVQQNIFEKTLIEVGSPHIYASFGTFHVQIGQLFEAQSSILQRLTVTRIIDQFGRKRCQKKRKDLSYQLLLEFVQKNIVVHELWAGKN